MRQPRPRSVPPRGAGLVVPVALALALALTMGGCASLSGDVGRGETAPVHGGKALANAKCAACHTVAGAAASPNPRAPPFAQIGQRYSRRGLVWELQAIRDVGHYNMPATPLSPREMEALATYIHRSRAGA